MRMRDYFIPGRCYGHLDIKTTNSFKKQLTKCYRPLSTHDQTPIDQSKLSEEGPFRMPVVPLKQSCFKLLSTVKPLLADSQYDSATKIVNKFIEPNGIGEKLQNLLEKRAMDKDSWLSEWWQNYSYLDYRSSVPINVSPGIIMKEQIFRDTVDQIRKFYFNSLAIRDYEKIQIFNHYITLIVDNNKYLLDDFAAKIISGILQYKRMLDDGGLQQEKMLGNNICMKQYYKIFSSCRRPRPFRDSIVQHDSKDCRHIVVIHNNHFFKVPICNAKGDIINLAQLRKHLHRVISLSCDKIAPPIGLMTGNDRNAWSDAQKRLLLHKENDKIIEIIEKSAFVLCLDKANSPELEPQPLTSKREPTDRYTTLGRQMNYGGGSNLNSANRWFDKTLQVIIGSDGAFGSSYEHTAAEGPPVINLIDFAYDFAVNCKEDYQSVEGVDEVSKLEFIIDEEIEQDMKKAAKSIDKQISRFELHAYTFREFGKNDIKAFKISPDAFIQVALQLAYFRLHGAPCATYESGSLRRFIDGRTDVIRSCSIDTLKYTMSMMDSKQNNVERAKALKNAIFSHTQYSKDVVLGNGIDRHLLGLKLVAEENNIPIPDLFKHPMWTESTAWKLSTSQVASKSDSLLTFGAVVTDGYGFCYNPCGDHINYMVSAWRESRLTKCEKFSSAVKQALIEGHILLTLSEHEKFREYFYAKL